MTKNRNLISLATAAFIALSTLPALALDLNAARTQGLVGETSSGLIAVVKSTSDPEVNALVSEVNAKRTAEYAKIAKQNGQTPDVVGQLAFKQIVDGLPPKALYQATGGGWQQK